MADRLRLCKIGGLTDWFCDGCRKGNRVETFACTCCHEIKPSKFGNVFREKKYRKIFNNPKVDYVLAASHRLIMKESNQEWICKACDAALVLKGVFQGKFKPCSVCKNSMCALKEEQGVVVVKKPMSTLKPTATSKQKIGLEIHRPEASSCQFHVDILNKISNDNRNGQHVCESQESFFRDVLADMTRTTSPAELEEYIMGRSEVFFSLPPITEFKGLEQGKEFQIDRNATRQISANCGIPNPVAIHSTGNGDCFLNTLSLVAFGDENHSDEMRVRVLIEAFRNADKYIDPLYLSGDPTAPPDRRILDFYIFTSHDRGFQSTQDHLSDYKRMMFDIRGRGKWAGLWQMHQAATVLQCVINGLIDEQGLLPNSPLMKRWQRSFSPIGEVVNPEFSVLYCRTPLSGNLNHFVPVLPCAQVKARETYSYCLQNGLQTPRQVQKPHHVRDSHLMETPPSVNVQSPPVFKTPQGIHNGIRTPSAQRNVNQKHTSQLPSVSSTEKRRRNTARMFQTPVNNWTTKRDVRKNSQSHGSSLRGHSKRSLFEGPFDSPEAEASDTPRHHKRKRPKPKKIFGPDNSQMDVFDNESILVDILEKTAEVEDVMSGVPGGDCGETEKTKKIKKCGKNVSKKSKNLSPRNILTSFSEAIENDDATAKGTEADDVMSGVQGGDNGETEKSEKIKKCAENVSKRKYNYDMVWRQCKVKFDVDVPCGCCAKEQRVHVKFFKENYSCVQKMSKKQQESLFRHCDLTTGQIFLCKECHVALRDGKTRRSWCMKKDANGQARSRFLDELEKFPVYICTVCHQRHFPQNVRPLNCEQFDLTNDEVSQCLSDEFQVKSFNEIIYIDKTCELKLKKGHMPSNAVANGLQIEETPTELQGLTILERRCIGLNIPFMKIQSARYGGKRINGPCVNVPAQIDKVATLLPRLPEGTPYVAVQLKRRLSYKTYYMADYIRPAKLINALIWLKGHHPGYFRVDIDSDFYEHLKKSQFADLCNEDNYPDGVVDRQLWKTLRDKKEAFEAREKEEKEKLAENVGGEKDKENSTEGTNGDGNKKKEINKDAEENGGKKKEQNLHGDDSVAACDEKGNVSDNDFEEQQQELNRRAMLGVEPSSTCVQHEKVEEAIYSIAPGEDSRPKLIITDENFEVNCFPDFFPMGEGSFSSERHQRLLMRDYTKQRLKNVDTKFAKNLEYIFSMQYAVELNQLETAQNVSIRRNKSNAKNHGLKASMLKDPGFLTQMISKDKAYRFMQTVRGTTSYWEHQLRETLAMFNTLGKPTWFLTLTAAENLWPELVQAIYLAEEGRFLTLQEVAEMSKTEKSNLIRRHPVISCMMWKHRIDKFMSEYIGDKDAAPLSIVEDYVVKTEFQARGSPHVHILLWVKDAPIIGKHTDEEVCEFIDNFVSGVFPTTMPDIGTDSSAEELDDLIKNLQIHEHGTFCRRSTKAHCRVNFPRPPSPRTIITGEDESKSYSTEDKKKMGDILDSVMKEVENDSTQSLKEILEKLGTSEDEYVEALKTIHSAKSIILKREPCDVFVNNYNANILSLWKAHMDIQYVVDPYQAINYVMKYVLKAEKGMSELMNRVAKEYADKGVREQMREITKAFVGKREVSIQESVFRVLSIPLCKKTRAVVFVSTTPEGSRDKAPKPIHEIQQMADDDENVFLSSIHDRYEARPESVENMCLADFAVSYSSVAAPKKPNSQHIKLRNELGWMRKKEKKSVLRTYSPKDVTEDYFRSQLMLFYPYRHECDLKGTCETFQERYDQVREDIETNSEKHNMFQKEIEAAYAEYQAAEELERAQMESEDDKKKREKDDNDDNANHSALTAKFRAEAMKGKLKTDEYLDKMRSCNEKQRQIVIWVRDFVKNQIRQMKNGQSPEGFKVVVTGAGGTGKSHVISLIQHVVVDLFHRTNVVDPADISPDVMQDGRNPMKPTALLTASTGAAAFNIGGSTIHSALLVFQNQLGADKASVLQSQLHQLQLLIIDECSMVGSQMLSLVNERCCFIKQNIHRDAVRDENRRNFGNINMTLTGDLKQLEPVMMTAIYKQPRITSLKDFVEPLWHDFKLHELTEVMRQKDKEFAHFLCRIREECPEENSADDLLLRSCEIPVPFEHNDYPRNVLHVFAQNIPANSYNEMMLNSLDGELMISAAVDSVSGAYGGQKVQFSEKMSDTGNLKSELKMKVGCRVMLTQNLDVVDGLTNGAYGKVMGFIQKPDDQTKIHCVMVKFDNQNAGKQFKRNIWREDYPDCVPIKRVEANFPISSGKKSLTATRFQFPLNCAYGVTIHKVQGLTMDKIVVNMDPALGRYKKGQAYVAFSRVTSLEGLKIKGYNRKQIKVDKDIAAEEERMRKNPVVPIPLSVLSTSDADLKLGFLNINGLSVGFTSFKEEDLCKDPNVQCLDVLCLAETHLNETHKVDTIFEVDIGLTNIFRRNRDGAGGGVLICAKNYIKMEQIHLETPLEIVGAKVSLGEKFVNIFCVYVPPRVNKTEAANQLEEILRNFQEEECIVVGDMNENLLEENSHSHIRTSLEGFGMKQYVSKPTSIHGSLIDHLYCSSQIFPEIVEVHDAYYSDHDLISTGCRLMF